MGAFSFIGCSPWFHLTLSLTFCSIKGTGDYDVKVLQYVFYTTLNTAMVNMTWGFSSANSAQEMQLEGKTS